MTRIPLILTILISVGTLLALGGAWVAGAMRETLALLKAIHLLAVIALVGGTFFNYTLVRPAQKAIPPPQAAVIATKVGRWFTWLVWVAIPTILITGLLRLVIMGRWDTLFTLGFYGSKYGRWMLIVVLLWLVMVVSASIITFFLNPALTRKLPPGSQAGPANPAWKVWGPLLYSPEREQPLWLTIASWTIWVAWGALGLILVASLLRLLAAGLPDSRWLLTILVIWLAFSASILAIKFIVAPALSRHIPAGSQPEPSDVARRQQLQIAYTHRLEQLVLAGLVAGALAAVAASSLAFGGWL